MRLIRNGVTVDFSYNGSTPATMTFNGNTYYYLTNVQGDIIGLTDSTGKIVMGYLYEAYGYPSALNEDPSLSATILYLNPFMYRGYVFDLETKLYYLQSRYYDPEMGRFINADSLVSTGQGILGFNMFAYCNNNPIIYIDPSGHSVSPTIHPVCWGGVESPLKTGPYDSAEEAALAFAEYIYSSSRYIRFEYGTQIYSYTVEGVTRYYFNYPTVGAPHSVSVGAPVPEGATMVAYAHTHPNSSMFSPKDISVAADNNWDAYVVGPDLTLRKYDVSAHAVSTIGPVNPRPLSNLDKAILVSLFYKAWDEHTANGCAHNCIEKVWPFTEGG